MGRAHELGSVREGYLADLLVVDGDPLGDIGVLQDGARLLAIMKGGTFVKDELAATAAPRWGAPYPPDMIIIAGSLSFESADRADVLASLAEVTEASRRDAGCVEYSWAEDLEAPEHVPLLRVLGVPGTARRASGRSRTRRPSASATSAA